ncbi:hypothetical protein MNEG_6757 [Monoraphidium neglectum]|uniref:Uncharacterized protein n=1 Tax=Monoraphidium neglectum TaxID=145388 RepID=A0A0D2JQ58_9CHLO|nr:hypothetical protein MNEG_6757 [Monoraphidium neglectum]KIZ01203.1 hypothetical protein MNEG_6757 [Monoraphidium neglectum]|eukprot:XP_013900222.1 hypothetical protein MNEG_6757 [Monoraphidium neglectum]
MYDPTRPPDVHFAVERVTGGPLFADDAPELVSASGYNRHALRSSMIDFHYRRAVAVVWPRALAADALRSGGLPAAQHLLGRRLAAGADAGAADVAAALDFVADELGQVSAGEGGRWYCRGRFMGMGGMEDAACKALAAVARGPREAAGAALAAAAGGLAGTQGVFTPKVAAALLNAIVAVGCPPDASAALAALAAAQAASQAPACAQLALAAAAAGRAPLAQAVADAAAAAVLAPAAAAASQAPNATGAPPALAPAAGALSQDAMVAVADMLAQLPPCRRHLAALAAAAVARPDAKALLKRLLALPSLSGAAGDPEAAAAVAALCEARRGHLEGQGRPAFSWEMPDAVVPNCPDIQAFLRGPEQSVRFTKFLSGVVHARTMAQRLFNSTRPKDKVPGCAQGRAARRRGGGGGAANYSATAEAGGKGKSAWLQVTKTRAWFDAQAGEAAADAANSGALDALMARAEAALAARGG